MSWKDLHDTQESLKQCDADALRDLFAISRLVRSAFFPKNYEVSDDWLHLIHLTPEAKMFLGAESKLIEEFSEKELRFALFLAFFHQDLFVDERRSDLAGLEEILSAELRDRKLLLPYRFGRLLYDRFNDTAPQIRTDHLEHAEAAELLEDTPQGVYQVGTYVTGPLGLLRSEEVRYNPPSSRLPLWHCSDTGCRALHHMTLRNESSGIAAALARLEALSDEKYGPRSNWAGPLRDLCRPGLQAGRRRFYDLPAVIAEAFVDAEREVLLTTLLASSSGNVLRDCLVKSRGSEAAKGSPAQVNEKLDEAGRIQLLLCLGDSILTRAVDRQIVNGSIRIPLYDTRHANLLPPGNSWSDLETDVSVFGLRARHPRPLLQLTAAIWAAYEASSNLEELGWRLRKRAGKPPRSALSEYMQRATPAEALRELVLPAMPIALYFSKEFGVELQPEVENQLLVDRLLWKLGFNPPRYEQEYHQFRERIQQFSDTLLRVGAIRSEKDREAVRSAGVNLFVSVEYFLEQLISYNVWILSTDHFLNDFKYSYPVALASIPRILGLNVKTGDTELIWDSSGGNTLGTLLGYLQKSMAWMNSLNSGDRADFARPAEDWPHFADSPELLFRFRSTQLWADADPQALKEYVEALNAVATQLNQANIASVRNGLDHKRPADQFPQIDVMLACAARLREALDTADVQRFVPKTFWLMNQRLDRYGRREYLLQDYRGRETKLFGPSTGSRVRGPGSGVKGPGSGLSFCPGS